MNDFGKSLKEWWESDECKELQEENEKAKKRAVEKYLLLSEEDKLDMVQAICKIICEAESKGCSHRGLMKSLGIYPSGFWIDYLMDVHNSIYSYYNKDQSQELNKDIDL
jgi:hypothetical protein